MRCDHFIETYSEYRDGLVTDEVRARYEHHLAECGRCRRYDHVVRQGAMVYSELPGPSVSHDFLPRLQHRIYHVEDAARLTTRRAVGSAALVAVAGVGFLAVTWLPFATRMSVEVQLPPVAVEAPGVDLVESRAPLFDTGPYLTPGSFLLPFHPTLDESSDLFPTGSLLIEERTYEAGGPASQLDSER
ncbi:MAG: zf-HC2 domain-containing protein [Gemmatimonadota bacterium]|nr:zf-HC2 domain-containing protein [Gemmatimonadota bacterium]